jgi:hypothetical protein
LDKRLFSSDSLLLVATGKVASVVGRTASLLQYEVSVSVVWCRQTVRSCCTCHLMTQLFLL